jgi:hypothetical protein
MVSPVRTGRGNSTAVQPRLATTRPKVRVVSAVTAAMTNGSYIAGWMVLYLLRYALSLQRGLISRERSACSLLSANSNVRPAGALPEPKPSASSWQGRRQRPLSTGDRFR